MKRSTTNRKSGYHKKWDSSRLRSSPLSTTYNQRLPKELLHVFERFLRDGEITHGPFPLHRERGLCPHLQRQLKSVNRLADQRFAILAARTRALVVQCGTQVVLGPGPLLRQMVVGVDRERLTIGLYGLGQQLRPVIAARAHALLAQHDTQVVLGSGPVLG